MLPLIAVMLALHNGARRAEHARPLRLDPVLTEAARRKAADAARCGFTHYACGRRWTFYLPRRRCLGENLAEGYDTPRATMRAWLRSPEHRANILRPAFRSVGFARVGRVYVVEFSS